MLYTVYNWQDDGANGIEKAFAGPYVDFSAAKKAMGKAVRRCEQIGHKRVQNDDGFELTKMLRKPNGDLHIFYVNAAYSSIQVLPPG